MRHLLFSFLIKNALEYHSTIVAELRTLYIVSSCLNFNAVVTQRWCNLWVNEKVPFNWNRAIGQSCLLMQFNFNITAADCNFIYRRIEIYGIDRTVNRYVSCAPTICNSAWLKVPGSITILELKQMPSGQEQPDPHLGTPFSSRIPVCLTRNLTCPWDAKDNVTAIIIAINFFIIII